MTPLLLALSLLAQGPLHVDTLRPVDGPPLAVHRQAGPLVALRLSVPVQPSLPEGAAELLQELARPDAEAEAERLGARLSLRHNEGRAVISVAGPVAAFDALATLLRRATTEPDLSVAALRQARARATDRVLARLEQPESRVRSHLWHALRGDSTPEGIRATLLTPEQLRDLLRRLYARDRLRVTVVGPLPDVVLRSAFSHWPLADPGTGSIPVPDSTGERARPQTHREWAGLAYPVEADGAALAVAADLVRRRIERSALRTGSAEPWSAPAGQALVLVGSTEPDDEVIRATARIGELPVREAGPGEAATGVGRYLRRMVAEAAALAGPEVVADARNRLRRELLLEARTASGKAEAIGRYWDSERAPDALPGFLAALDAVGLEDVRSLLTDVLAARAYYAEAR